MVMGPTDLEVIERSWEQPEAFSELFHRYFAVIHSYCTRRAGVDRADDLAGETFRIAFERRRAYDRSRRDAGPWLYGIAHNALRNSLRSDGRERELYLRLAHLQVPVPDPSSSAVDALEASRVLDLVAKALRTSPLDEVDTLLLHVWENLSYSEIAVALDIPVGTVGSRITRLRARLREAIDYRSRANGQKQNVTR